LRTAENQFRSRTINSWADLIIIMPIAVSLGVDAFSVALGASVFPTENERRRAFRLVWHFGLFQGGMALLGWLVGRSIEPIIADYDHWVAFVLLAYVGGRMLRSGLRGEIESNSADPSRGMMLVMMSVGTSIDALAIGMSLALSGSQILWPSLIIGVVAAAMTFVGLKIGHGLGIRFGRQVQVFGGLVLILIGIRVVVSHLSA
jgi:putative Mn2+ efflux pump MntP